MKATMNTLKAFDDYLLSITLEAVANDEIVLLLSNRLRTLLSSIKHPIAQAIIESERKEGSKYKVSFLDIDNSDPNELDKISYLTSSKVKDIHKEESGEDKPLRDEWYYWIDYVPYMSSRYRSSTSIGRIVKKLFGDKFKPSGEPGEDIQSFVDMYKAKRSTSDFEIVSGDDIVYWYNKSNYLYLEGEDVLNNSCMRYDRCGLYLKFYSMNSERITLLILKDKDNKDKIRGRALIWKLDEPDGRIFMDRIYYVEGYEVELFKQYASEKGWLYKNKQNSDEEEKIVDTKDGSNKQRILVTKDIAIPGDEQFPYMDTMKFLDANAREITNEFNRLNHTHRIYKLEGTEGNDYDAYDRYYDEWRPKGDVEIVEDDVIGNIRYYSSLYPNLFWNCMDDEAYVDHIVETETDRRYERFVDVVDKEEVIRAVVLYVLDNGIELPISGTYAETQNELYKELRRMDIEKIKNTLDENNLLFSVVKEMTQEQYRNMEAEDICKKLYGDCSRLSDDVFDTFSSYLDEDCFADAVVETHNE